MCMCERDRRKERLREKEGRRWRVKRERDGEKAKREEDDRHQALQRL